MDFRKIIILVVVLLWGCETNQVSEDKDISTVITEEITQELNSKNLYKAFQLLTYYKSTSFNNDLLKDSEDELTLLFPQKLEYEFSSGKWEDFFVTYRNLKNLGIEAPEYDLDKILLEYILNQTKDKLFKYGVLLAEESLEYKNLSDADLINLESLFRDITPDSEYPRLLAELNNRNIQKMENLNGEDYLEGVFTVYVNKGINFENGIGSSDIVVGSGFFIDKSGHGITNYHVIESLVDPKYEGINHLYVKLNGSQDKVPAKIVGWDPVMDLALIKISTKPKYIYSINKNSENTVGKSVVAVGSPGGLSSTVTRGIISAVDRTLLQYGSVIQIDTPINPGNSGGPLIDEDNRVTNVVFAGIEEFEGVNFAIPAKYLLGSLKELYLGGEVQHVWFGAGLTYRKKKLEVIYIKPNTPAFMLNLKKGDIINSVNGISFDSIIEIQDYLLNFQPNEIVEITYTSNGVKSTKKICLERRPSVPTDSILEGDTSDHLYIPLFGMDIEFTGKVFFDKKYLINDVFPGTIADDLELKKGDVIVVRNWEYNDEYKVVILMFTIMSQQEGFFEKTIQIVAPIKVNFFI